MRKLVYVSSTYVADNSTYIRADLEDGDPWCDVSVCLECYGMTPPDENHIYIPVYKMDPDTLETFRNYIIEKIVDDKVPIGFGTGWLVKLKDNWKEIAPAL
jgi:hypothetical protein